MKSVDKSALAVVLAGMASTALGELEGVCPERLALADTGIEGMEELSRAFGPFADAFSEHTGLDIEFFAVSDRTAAATALRYDEVDLVLAGPSEYAVIEARQDIDIVFGLERDEYGTRFMVPASSSAESLPDLSGKRVALGSVASTTNHIVPSWMLVEAGLDIDRDIDLVMAGDARIRALANGDVDALGGGYRDVEVLERIAPDFEYRVIADSGTMPRDPIIARSGLGSECIEGIRSVVEAHSDTLFEAFVAPAEAEGDDEAQERSKYLGARFVFDVTDDEYDLIREAYEIVGLSLN